VTMFHIKSILPKVLQKPEIRKQIEATQICKIADKIMSQTLGSKSAKALFFRNSILQLRCSNSVVANEIQLRKERIRNEINEKLGKETVKNILTRMG